MRRYRAVFLAIAVLGLSLVAPLTPAAEYPAAASPVPPNNSQPPPYPPVEAGPPGAAAGTNQPSPPAAELELRTQFKLLSALAQEHRQRAEAATGSDQAQRAQWEAELAAELGNRGSNILAQLEELAARRPALPSGGPAEAAAPLSPAETDYLAKIQQRLQTVQQQFAAAIQEVQAYALQAVSNRNTVVYGDNSLSLRQQAVAADLQRLQAEQAELDLKTSQFWALRALVGNLQHGSPAETKAGSGNAPVPEPGK